MSCPLTRVTHFTFLIWVTLIGGKQSVETTRDLSPVITVSRRTTNSYEYSGVKYLYSIIKVHKNENHKILMMVNSLCWATFPTDVEMYYCLSKRFKCGINSYGISLAGLISSYSYSDASACCTYKRILNKGLGGGFDFYSLSANKLIDNGWMVYMYLIL